MKTLALVLAIIFAAGMSWADGLDQPNRENVWRPWQEVWQCNDVRVTIASRSPEEIEYDLGGMIWGGSRFTVVRGNFYNRWLPNNVCGCAGCSGDLPPPSPPAEEATARQDQAGQSRTGDGAGDCGCRSDVKLGDRKVKATGQCRVRLKLPDELVWVCYGKVRAVGIQRVDRKLIAKSSNQNCYV